jgi:hypothetical protein
MRICLCQWRLGGCVSVQVVTWRFRRSHCLGNIGNGLFDLEDVIMWLCEVLVGNCLPSITVSYLSRLESSRACIFNTVIGINCALVVYQYLYVASNAADDIVCVNFWLGVWWKMVGMLKSCMLWRTKILSHMKPAHTLTPSVFKIHIITAFWSMARSPKWSFLSTFPSNSFDYFSDKHLYTFCGSIS